MSKLIAPSNETAIRQAPEITDISASANPHAFPPVQREALPEAAPLPPDGASRHSLKSLDRRHGPLRIGEVLVSRVELKALGAIVNGEPISAVNSQLKTPDQAFLDGLNFNAAKVEARLKSSEIADSGVVATLFFELACKRSVDASPMFVSAEPLAPGSAMERLNKLGNAAQKLDIHRVESFENAPGWVSKSKSYLTSGAGVGLQAYGIYSGYMGMIDAIKKGETLEAVYQGGSIAAEFASLILEQGLAKGGEALLHSSAVVFKRFPLTSAGKYLKRGSGLLASVITLPFDVIDAVKSLNAAAASQGKEAQDHYVSAGFSIAGASITVILGVAALAGYASVAGPLGLAAAALLISGIMIYQAARVVDDIDDYIELTAHERLRSGWFAFTGQELDKEVMDRFKISKAYSDSSRQLEASSKALLDGAYKNFVEHIVNGSFSVELKPVKHWRYQWNESAGEQAFKIESETVIKGGDDVIDARDGLPADLKGSVKGEPGDKKGIFWNLGDGNDQVVGVKARPNHFTFREGHKALTGGDKDDTFYLESTEAELNRTTAPAHSSVLDGGEGADTLIFQGSRPVTDTHHVGYNVNLQSGKVALRSHAPGAGDVEIAQIKSFENLSTMRNGLSRVTASDGAERISANGSDHIDAGGGDDTVAIRGVDCRVDGGSGVDRYFVAATSARATIVEDGQASSVIEFDWVMDRIQQWQIVDTSLVITSRQDEDGIAPDHVLTIENVYKQVDEQRQVNNNRLQFKTADGYEMTPLLPTRLTGQQEHAVECIITAMGKRAHAPQIVNGGTVDIGAKGAQHTFVSRGGRRVDFRVPTHAVETSATVFLSYASTEINDVRISYTVTVKEGNAGNRYLTYEHFNLWLLLPEKTLTFTGVIRRRSKADGYTGIGTLTATIAQVAHQVTLIMQDGQAYRLALPLISYRDDAATPGPQSRAARECLKPLPGKRTFIKPSLLKPVLLAARPQQVDLPPPPHAGIYALHGQASSYDIYPVSNSTFSLLTPGAVALTSNASLWTIFSTKMGETVQRTDIRLTAEELQIGSVTVQLPSVDHPGPVESISVATSSGNLYAVELLFSTLQLTVINAQGYTDMARLLADIQAHRQRNGLAITIAVKHLRATPALNGTVYYNSTHDYWGIDTHPTYRIKPEDLIIEPATSA